MYLKAAILFCLTLVCAINVAHAPRAPEVVLLDLFTMNSRGPASDIAPTAPAPGNGTPSQKNKVEVDKALKLIPPGAMSGEKPSTAIIPAVSPVPGKLISNDENLDPKKLSDPNSCDPRLFDAFYQNILTALCKEQTKLAFCPWTTADYLIAAAKPAVVLGVGAAAGAGLTMVSDHLNARDEANMARQDIRFALNSIKDFDEKAFEQAGLKQFVTKDVKGVIKQEELNDLLAWLARSLTKEEAAEARVATTAALRAATKVATKKIAIRALALGVLTAGLSKVSFVLDLFLNSTPTGCDGDDARYITRDAKCAFQFDMSPSVVNFLSLNGTARHQALENPNVCSFYTIWNDKLRRESIQDPPKNIVCSSDKITFDYTLQENSKTTPIDYHMILDIDDAGSSTDMRVYAKHGDPQSSRVIDKFTIDFTTQDDKLIFRDVRYPQLDGKKQARYVDWDTLSSSRYFFQGNYETDHYYPIFKQALVTHKTFAPIIRYCCAIKDDTKRAKCIRTLENTTNETMGKVEQKVETSSDSSK